MSDGFDKEAEREKLREKFAEDEKKREHTQQMSELLLQGATMTNRHCETCGDPIFRHDGREFCPTCHATEDGYEVPADDGTGTGDGREAANAGETTPPETVPPETAPPETVPPETAPPETDPDRPESSTAGIDAEPTGVGSERDASSGGVGRSSQSTAASPNSVGEATLSGNAAGDGVTDGIVAARESLTRTLNRFARAAEETDDPRRARDHLRAAREAAEALAALE